MPYIKEGERHDVARGARSWTTGELNYILTTEILRYLKHHGLRYGTINDIIGALESAKAEFQRRVVGKYEDKKISENSDLEGYKQ